MDRGEINFKTNVMAKKVYRSLGKSLEKVIDENNTFDSTLELDQIKDIDSIFIASISDIDTDNGCINCWHNIKPNKTNIFLSSEHYQESLNNYINH